MSVSRRSFLSSLGLGGAGLVAAPSFAAIAGRGREAAWLVRDADAIGGSPYGARGTQGALIKLDSNENPNGPGRRALDAINAALGQANRYPDPGEVALADAIARVHGCGVENVVLGCGSSETLRLCVEAFTSPTRALVTAAPTFEPPGEFAALLGHPVVSVPVDRKLALDLDQMSARATNAGLVFFCNPNNPTATVHGDAAVRAFIAQVHRTAPEAVVLVDEAYHEYVDDASYRTAIPLALADPKVIVSRTFSKVFGMAGLRAGYAIAHRDTARRMNRFRLGAGVNVLALAAATATVGDAPHIAAEQRANREAKAFTRAWFEKAGYMVGASETNFLMIDLKRDPAPVRAACRQAGVAVGRPFPPLDTWLRVSIGTMGEMQRASEVFGRVLRP